VNGDEVRVSVELNIPSDRTLESLEIVWNDELLSRLSEAPYEAWVTIDRSVQFGLLRAVATLDDQSVAEDIQFVNAPEFGSVVDVTAVELPVTVWPRSDAEALADRIADENAKGGGRLTTMSDDQGRQHLPVMR